MLPPNTNPTQSQSQAPTESEHQDHTYVPCQPSHSTKENTTTPSHPLHKNNNSNPPGHCELVAAVARSPCQSHAMPQDKLTVPRHGHGQTAAYLLLPVSMCPCLVRCCVGSRSCCVAGNVARLFCVLVLFLGCLGSRSCRIACIASRDACSYQPMFVLNQAHRAHRPSLSASLFSASESFPRSSSQVGLGGASNGEGEAKSGSCCAAARGA